MNWQRAGDLGLWGSLALLVIIESGRLFLVEGTVKAYVSAILTRLQVKNRVQAAIVAYEAGLVTD